VAGMPVCSEKKIAPASTVSRGVTVSTMSRLYRLFHNIEDEESALDENLLVEYGFLWNYDSISKIPRIFARIFHLSSFAIVRLSLFVVSALPQCVPVCTPLFFQRVSW